MRIAHEREQRKLQAEAAEAAVPSAPTSAAAQRSGSLTEHLEVGLVCSVSHAARLLVHDRAAAQDEPTDRLIGFHVLTADVGPAFLRAHCVIRSHGHTANLCSAVLHAHGVICGNPIVFSRRRAQRRGTWSAGARGPRQGTRGCRPRTRPRSTSPTTLRSTGAGCIRTDCISC